MEADLIGKKISFLIISILSLSLVSAQYYASPEDFFGNEWFSFAVVFVIFFALIFFALERTFKGNKSIAIALAVILSLFISFSLSKSFFLNQYLGQWAIIIAILIALASLLKITTSFFGISIFLLLLTIILTYLKMSVDPYEVFPYEILISPVMSIYNLLVNWLIIAVLAILTLFFIRHDFRQGKFKRAFRNKRRFETIAEHG